MYKQKIYLFLNSSEPGQYQFLAIDDKGEVPFVLNDSQGDVLKVKQLLQQKGYTRKLEYEIHVLTYLKELPLQTFVLYHKKRQKENFEAVQLQVKNLLVELKFGNRLLSSVAMDIGIIIEKEKQFVLQQHLEMTKLAIDQCAVEEKEDFNFEDGVRWAGLKLEENLKELV